MKSISIILALVLSVYADEFFSDIPDHEEHRVAGCEEDKLFLACNNRYNKLNIGEVFYGRDNAHTCRSKVLGTQKMCHPDNNEHIAKKVRMLCHGENRCKIPVSADFMVDEKGKEICPDVRKYLVVNYNCQQVPKIAKTCGVSCSPDCFPKCEKSCCNPAAASTVRAEDVMQSFISNSMKTPEPVPVAALPSPPEPTNGLQGPSEQVAAAQARSSMPAIPQEQGTPSMMKASSLQAQQSARSALYTPTSGSTNSCDSCDAMCKPLCLPLCCKTFAQYAAPPAAPAASQLVTRHHVQSVPAMQWGHQYHAVQTPVAAYLRQPVARMPVKRTVLPKPAVAKAKVAAKPQNIKPQKPVAVTGSKKTVPALVRKPATVKMVQNPLTRSTHYLPMYGTMKRPQYVRSYYPSSLNAPAAGLQGCPDVCRFSCQALCPPKCCMIVSK